MFANQSIFKQLHAPKATREVAIPNGVATIYSVTAVGVIQGEFRTIPALMSEGVTEQDLFYLVNLEDSGGQYLETVAVLGSTSEEQARAWAIKQFGAQYGGAHGYEVACATAVGIKRYLDRPSAGVAKIKIRQADINTVQAQLTGTPVQWKQAECLSHTTSNLIFDMMQYDDQKMLLDSMSHADFAAFVAEGSTIAEYDALIVENSRLDALMARLVTAMDKAAIGDIKVSTMTKSKPFKRNGVVNVACLFDMTDGQTVTIVFHNPDSTPSKLAASDVMTSWKWLLNKRDISAAVQPKQGENVNLNDLAIRILKIVNQNSKRFQRTQAQRNKDAAQLEELNTRLVDKKGQLDKINSDNADLQKQIDELAANPVPHHVVDLGNNESLVQGVFPQADGTYTAMTLTESKNLKTRAGAENWLAKRGLKPDGTKLDVTPEPNPDVAYLQSIIDGTADLSAAESIESELEAISTRLTEDTQALFEQAANAFAIYAIAQANQV